MTFAALLVTLPLTGCGMRLETPPPPTPTADASETGRAATVAQAELIAAAAEGASSDPAAAVVLERLDQVAAGSRSHAASLGGPGPDPDPGTASPSATPDTPDAGAADLHGAIAALVAGHDQARADLTTATAEAAPLLASIALWRAVAARELAGALPEGVQGLPDGGLTTADLDLATLRDVGPLVRGLDAAGYAYEVLAARSSDDTRRADLVARAEQLRAEGDLLAVRAGIADGGEDPREALYDVSALVAGEESVAVVAVETDLVRLWLGSDLPPTTRPIAVDAALESLLRARALTPTAALDSPAAVLPGL